MDTLTLSPGTPGSPYKNNKNKKQSNIHPRPICSVAFIKNLFKRGYKQSGIRLLGTSFPKE